MCGIAGKIYFNKKEVKEADLKRMTEAIAHRGPDDDGLYVSKDKSVGLGHRRLSIIDLSPLGHQPMNYTSRYWIVFNGEIYNFQAERELLVKDGYKFKSQTDTEVILALYDKYKEKCLDHLRGMFSFAIYDEKEKTLFCARDRVGKKPFKYYCDNEQFVFASELKAILTDKTIKRIPDKEAIHHYLSFQYIPAPLTGFQNIKKLPPAHYLICKDGKISIKRYWSLDFTQPENRTESEWSERIMTKLRESTKIRLMSDVPLGALLSGGVDSSAIVGLMSEVSDQPVKTFSIGFKDQKFNELPIARLVAEKFGTDHTELIVEPEAIDILPKLVEAYEEPYADSSALPSYYVAQMAREKVTVALNGDGGDENFAGYPIYNAWLFASRIPKPLRRLINWSSPLFEKFISDPTLKFRLEDFAHAIIKKPSSAYFDFFSSTYFTEGRKRSLYDQKYADDLFDLSYKKVDEYFDNGLDPVTGALDFGIKTYLPEDLLVKVDIASMVNALEGRSPLLDHEFMELTAKIPAGLKIKNGQNKYIFKKALAGFVPNEVLNKGKKGFSIPIDSWFRGDLNKYAKDVILDKRSVDRGMFDRGFLEKMFREHDEKTVNHGSRIWMLMWLELWFREYFD